MSVSCVGNVVIPDSVECVFARSIDVPSEIQLISCKTQGLLGIGGGTPYYSSQKNAKKYFLIQNVLNLDDLRIFFLKWTQLKGMVSLSCRPFLLCKSIRSEYRAADLVL
jgi:hypothetical protein